MSYGQIPLRKANGNLLILMWRWNYNADFNDCFIAASFIKNYKLLKNSVTD